MTKERVRQLVDRASTLSGLERLEVMEQGVRLFLSWYGDNPDWPGKVQVKIGSAENKPVCPVDVLSDAQRLGRQRAFTLDDLIVEVYGSDVFVWEPKAIKNRFASLLRAAGFQCRQKRRGEERILAWGLPPELQQQIALAQQPKA